MIHTYFACFIIKSKLVWLFITFEHRHCHLQTRMLLTSMIHTLPTFQCLKQYISFEVMEGAYDVSCPDPSCISQVTCNLHCNNSCDSSSVVPIAFFYFPIPFLLSLSGDTQSEPDGGFDRQTVDGEASDIQTKHRQVSRHLPVIFSDQSDVGSLHVIRIISPITGCWLLITQYSPEKLLSAPSHNFVTRT